MTDPTGLGRNLFQRILDATGFRIAYVGERLNQPWLIYNPLLFVHFDRFAKSSAPGVVSVMRTIYPWAKTFLDVGSGGGAFAVECRKAGLEVTAIENSKHGRAIAARKGIECGEFDLTKSPPSGIQGLFDVSYCFEVAEHIPEALACDLVRFIAVHSTSVCFTAAQPGQTGFGHVNCQPKVYWVERFKSLGFEFEEERTELATKMLSRAGVAYWFTQNLLLFRRLREADRDT